MIGNASIEKWRVVKKGAFMTVDGKQYWWCPHHIDKGTLSLWNRIYVTHKPENHDDVMTKRYRCGQHDTAVQSDGAVGRNSNGNNLVISQKLKEVLFNKLMISDTDADNICNDICGQEKDQAQNNGCMANEGSYFCPTCHTVLDG